MNKVSVHLFLSNKSRNDVWFGLLRDLKDLTQLQPEINQPLQNCLPFFVDIDWLVFLEVDADGDAD